MPDTWATGCRWARHALGWSQAGPNGLKTCAESVADATRSGALPPFLVVAVATLATLAAVAAAVGCSCGVTLPPLRHGRIDFKFDARIREKQRGKIEIELELELELELVVVVVVVVVVVAVVSE